MKFDCTFRIESSFLYVRQDYNVSATDFPASRQVSIGLMTVLKLKGEETAAQFPYFRIFNQESSYCRSKSRKVSWIILIDLMIPACVSSKLTVTSHSILCWRGNVDFNYPLRISSFSSNSWLIRKWLWKCPDSRSWNVWIHPPVWTLHFLRRIVHISSLRRSTPRYSQTLLHRTC